MDYIISSGTLAQVTSAFLSYAGNIDSDIARRLMDRMTQLSDTTRSHEAPASHLDGLEDVDLEAGVRLPEEVVRAPVPVGAGVGLSGDTIDGVGVVIAGARQEENPKIRRPAGNIRTVTVVPAAPDPDRSQSQSTCN